MALVSTLYKAPIVLPGNVRLAPVDWLGSFRSGRDSTFVSGLRSIVAHSIKNLNSKDRPFFLREAKDIVKTRGLVHTNATTQLLAKDALAALNDDLAKIIWPSRDNFAGKGMPAKEADLEKVLAVAKEPQHDSVVCPWVDELTGVLNNETYSKKAILTAIACLTETFYELKQPVIDALKQTANYEPEIMEAAKVALRHLVSDQAKLAPLLTEMDGISRTKVNGPGGPGGGSTPPPNEIFTGHQSNYEKVRVIGKGGMGEVLLTKNSVGNLVCIKQIPVKQMIAKMRAESKPKDEIESTLADALLRFYQEYTMGQSLSHPVIARTLDTNLDILYPRIGDKKSDKFKKGFDLDQAEAAKPAFVVVEFIPEEAGSDQGAPDLNKYFPTEMKEKVAVDLFHPLLQGLSYAHKNGVFHRDGKPKNILVVKGADGQPQLKLIDFGIAKDENRETQLTSFGQLPGTRNYMAPIRTYMMPAKTDKALNAQIDIYQQALLIYERITKDNPFTRMDDHEYVTWLNSENPVAPIDPARIENEDLRRILVKALASRPADNFPSMEAFDAELQAIKWQTTSN